MLDDRVLGGGDPGVEGADQFVCAHCGGPANQRCTGRAEGQQPAGHLVLHQTILTLVSLEERQHVILIYSKPNAHSYQMFLVPNSQ